MRYVKLPYGSIFACGELLLRMAAVGEILWFRMEPTRVITPEIRASLERFIPALTKDTTVNWTA